MVAPVRLLHVWMKQPALSVVRSYDIVFNVMERHVHVEHKSNVVERHDHAEQKIVPPSRCYLAR